MATVVTAPEHHRDLSDLSFNKDADVSPGQSFGLVPEDQISPCSPLFPVLQSPSLMSNSPSGPVPNPPFVFPARQMPSSAPSSFSRATGRRPKSAYELQGATAGFGREINNNGRRVAPPPLPAFSFLQAPLAKDTSSPPHSPQTPLSPQSMSTNRSIPTRPGGHRRGGSEFIGGDGKNGTGMGLLSTSPTKGDGALPTPSTTASLGPSSGRRGHAHRRSAAISCHDLSMILQPPASSPVMGGSAPTSPSDREYERMSFPGLDATVQAIPAEVQKTETSEVASPPDSPRRSTNRARVGFSDTIEFIPRPLSLVSSDASSTTTMRPGHSVSNSLSSIMSLGTMSPPTKDSEEISSPPNPHANNDSRPSTAGAIFGSPSKSLSENYSPRRRTSLPSLTDDAPIPEADLHPKALAKKYFFFGQESTAKPGSPILSRPVSSGSERSKSPRSASIPSSPADSTRDAPMESIEAPNEASPVRKTSLTRKPSKKQKKVKSWAGSILSRKSRQRSQKQKALNRRSPTPPLRSYEPTPGPEEPTPEFTEADVPATVPENPHSPGISRLQTDFASWKPRHVAADEDTMSPIIDLDAALGPFNTPSMFDSEWEAAQRGPGGNKRKMHSAGGKSGYISPYHRRAESAPEMVAFENPRFNLHHIGSRSTMEDVFEEDEEDDWEELKSISHKSSKTPVEEDEETPELGINIQVVEADNVSNDMDWTVDSASSIQRGVKRKGSGLSDSDEERYLTSGADNRLPTFDHKDGSTHDSSRPASSKTTNSEAQPTPSLRSLVAMEASRPVDIQPLMFQQPFLAPNSPQSSSHSPFPSPRSPMSYDAQRISTAPSSFTDEPATFQSLLLGEPGPELFRMSVDDVPSLTSSNSTMTRESMVNPAVGNPQFRGGQRSASMSAPSITRKRSSMASLSRLLTSSHGEKSKLSIEERAPSSPDKKEKGGKAKRLSRLMQFWKPKEESET